MAWLDGPKETTRYLDLLLQLAEHHQTMIEKPGLSAPALASKLGKSRAEVNRWISA